MLCIRIPSRWGLQFPFHLKQKVWSFLCWQFYLQRAKEVKKLLQWTPSQQEVTSAAMTVSHGASRAVLYTLPKELLPDHPHVYLIYNFKPPTCILSNWKLEKVKWWSCLGALGRGERGKERVPGCMWGWKRHENILLEMGMCVGLRWQSQSTSQCVWIAKSQ